MEPVQTKAPNYGQVCMSVSTPQSIGELVLCAVCGLGVGAICMMAFRSASWINQRFKGSRGLKTVQALMLRLMLFIAAPLAVSIALFYLVIGLKVAFVSFLVFLIAVAFSLAVEIRGASK